MAINNSSGINLDEAPEAADVAYDNSSSGFTATDVQGALDEIANTVATSASPGFSFGRASNVSGGTWLQCESVPSNKAGRFVYISNAVVKTIFVSNENVSTFDVAIYHHEGDEVNLTLVDTVSIVSSRGGSFAVDQPVPTGTQLAILVSSGSARNIVCGLELTGTN